MIVSDGIANAIHLLPPPPCATSSTLLRRHPAARGMQGTNIIRVILTRVFYPGINPPQIHGADCVSDSLSKPSTAFEGHRMLLSGPLVEVALAVKTAVENSSSSVILVFDDATGRVVDLDLRGTKAEIIERLSRPPQTFVGRYRPRPSELSPSVEEEASEPKGRGRPKLGVVSREVTLLPRQWEWLAAQPGGASAVLRRLVDDARRNGGSLQKRRAAQEAACQFMLGIAGDFPGYEEATRALFADDRAKLEQCISDWPEDIQAHVLRLAFGAQDHAV